ncbi:MAG: hypothetical protein AAGF11_01540 [Myxococcota bacterium]
MMDPMLSMATTMTMTMTMTMVVEPDMIGPVQVMWTQVAAYAPTIASGVVVLLVGWLAAVVVRKIVARVLGMTRLDKAVRSTRLARILEAFREDLTPSLAMAGLVYAAILLLATMAAADVLGLDAIEDAVGAALGYVPRLVSALLVIAIGAYAAGAARRAVGAVLHEMRNSMASTIESVTEIGLLGLAALVAIDLLGIDISFLTSSLGMVLAVVLATLAFLFAWSMRRPAEEIIANYYLRRLIRLGDEIELGEIRGTAERFCPLGLLLRDAEGQQHFVPARHVLDGLTRRGADEHP